VPGRGADKQDCLSQRVQAQFADALVVHRLDMATSGLLLMARGADSQKRLNAAFSERRVDKRYSAIVSGDCRASGADWQTIDLPILVDWPNRPLRKIDAQQGKPSQTRWRCLGYDAVRHCSRLELDPLTGRSHQLRLHLQAIGHPILGDPWYAPADIASASPRLLLHASQLALAHPHSDQPLAFHCPDHFGPDWP